MTKHQRKPSSYDANAMIPESLNEHFIQRIQNLPGSNSKVLYLKSEFLSKYVSDETDPASVRKQRAINKWLATERENEATNCRLLTLCEEYRILPHVTYRRFVDKCREFILTIIGDLPPWESFIGTFSGGASTSRKRTESHPASKYLGQADVTAEALAYFEDLLDDMPLWRSIWGDVDFRIVPGNVMFTVPKNTTIDRCACKEPDINMFLQKGIGSFIRASLQRVGINLNDQSRNRDLARLGSRDGSLATLDLSSASDSVSSVLVQELLPPVWYSAMNALRSPVTIIDGEEHVNEMFSSMGNGFTFELESLLFYAIARTTAYFEGVSGVISVYGDDIICPVSVADSISWALRVFGFEVNAKKSYASGPFRESCGGHYENGYDITPFYLRKPMTRLTDLIHMANSLRRWAQFDGLGLNDPDVWDLWSFLQSFIPKSLWGGRDLSSITQLVSPDYPKHRLLPITDRERLGAGSYVHWHNVNWDRQSARDGSEALRSYAIRRVQCGVPLDSSWVRENAGQEAIEVSWLSKPRQKFRLRPAAKADVLPLSSFFLEEL